MMTTYNTSHPSPLQTCQNAEYVATAADKEDNARPRKAVRLGNGTTPPTELRIIAAKNASAKLRAAEIEHETLSNATYLPCWVALERKCAGFEQ